MQEPRTWDLSLFLEQEDPRVREQIRRWVDLLQEHYEAKKPVTIAFEVPDGESTPEGAATPVFERLLLTYANVGSETRLEPGYKKGKGYVLSADFIFLDEPENKS